MQSPTAIRDLKFYNQVARLHIEGINRGFLATLGLPFLALLYEAIDHCPASVLVVEQQGVRVTGFVSGAASMRPIYRQLLRRLPRLTLALLPSLIKLSRLRRILEILRYSRYEAVILEQQTSYFELPEFELLSIVVATDARGSGCAEKLYTELVQYCGAHQIDAFKIVVGDALSTAHRFYKRMGAIPVGHVEVHAGEGSVVYIHQIASKG